jgi:hypothetical protein
VLRSICHLAWSADVIRHHLSRQPSNTEADWIRRAGVLVAIAGTAIAAPDGVASIWHGIMHALQRGWTRTHLHWSMITIMGRRAARHKPAITPAGRTCAIPGSMRFFSSS